MPITRYTQQQADSIAEPYRTALRLEGFEPVPGYPQRFRLPKTNVVATVDIYDEPVITYTTDS